MHDQWRAVTFCVIVGNNSDVGAGSSIMGTLSGGGQLASAHF